MSEIGDRVMMFPWFAMGHMTPFLHLANKLAEKGVAITFLTPNGAIKHLQLLSKYAHLISFHPLVIPSVDGLPPGTETASEIPIEMTHFLAIAMDQTRDQVHEVICTTKPKMVVYDMAHWVPEITKPLGIKTMNYNVVSAASIALLLVPSRKGGLTEEELSKPPKGYPSSKVLLHRHEVKSLLFVGFPFGKDVTFFERIYKGMNDCDVIGIRTCQEIEAQFCDYISTQYEKRVLLTGPMLSESSGDQLQEKWAEWLSRFDPGTVLFCAFGSQYVLDLEQFQELVLGFELTGFPFLIALRPPRGLSTVEEALPEGFQGRVRERGVVWGEWVQQTAILRHPSVGCFVNHCGFGSMWESLMSDCQIVLVPHLGDQILNTRLMVDELEVAKEVERDVDGWFSKENLSQTIMVVMDGEGQVGSKLQKNHQKWKNILCNHNLMTTYIDNFFQNVQEIISDDV